MHNKQVQRTVLALSAPHDPAMALPVEDEVTIEILEEEAPHGPKTKPKPKPSGFDADSGGGKEKPGTGSDAPTHGLLKYILLTKNGRHVGDQESEPWPEGFAEYDGGVIRDLGSEGVIYLINRFAGSDEDKPGVILDYDAEGNIVGIEVLQASKRTDDPSRIEMLAA